MKFCFAIICVLVSIIYPNYQIDRIEQKLYVIAYWEKNFSLDYIVENNTIVIDNEDTVRNLQTGYNLTFKILDSIADGYRISVKLKDNKVDLPIEWFTPLCQFLKNAEIIYTTNNMGEFRKLENFQELQKIIKTEINTQRKNSKNNIAQEYLKTAAIKCNTEESLVMYYLTDIVMMHHLYGLELNIVKPIEFSTTQQNPGSDVVMKKNVSYIVDYVDTINHFYQIRSISEIDGKDLRKQINATMKKSGHYNPNDAHEEVKKVQNSKYLTGLYHENGILIQQEKMDIQKIDDYFTTQKTRVTIDLNQEN